MNIEYVDENKTDGCQHCIQHNPKAGKHTLTVKPVSVVEETDTGITLKYVCPDCKAEWTTGWGKMMAYLVGT